MVSLVVLAGCCEKVDTIVLLPDFDGKVGSLEVAGSSGEIIIDKANHFTKLSSSLPSPSTPQQLSQEELQTLFGNVFASEPPPPTKFILYFLSGTSQLDTVSTTLLDDIHSTIIQKKSQDISIIGHTDTLGGAQFNSELSYERAMTIKTLLEDRGIAADIFEVTSHGEKNPLIKTPDNTPEKRNRRVEITIR